MSKLEKTRKMLKREIHPARPNMKAFERELYANEETGTVVYQVFTSNMTLPYPVTERIEWAYFLIGNESGCIGSGTYVSSEARFSIGKISENKNIVRIPRNGYETIHFGLQVRVDNLEFRKDKFRPYGGDEK